MKNDITNGEIIRKWLDGELSQEEIDDLKPSNAYDDYKKIIEASDALHVPDYDIENEYFKIQNSNNTKNSPVRRIKKWMYAAAAILIVSLGSFYFINQTTSYQTGFGEQLVITLPDDSKVRINSNSTLEFKDSNWEEKRIVELTGEGFFEVEKGEAFLVQTKEGTVEVLGTKFNVSVQSNFFEVRCLEGKVKASDLENNSAILNKGMAFRNFDGDIQKWNFISTKPSWVGGESTFENAPLKQVLITFENQYNVAFESKNIDVNQHFTGGFTHKNLSTALETLFDAMEISYTFEEERKIVLFKSE